MAELQAALDHLAGCESILIATDFDGVLAPIVLDPMAARPLDGTVDALRALASLPRTTVAVVSGRDLDTLRSLSGIAASEPIVLVGSHGAESSVDLALDTSLDETQVALLDRAETQLSRIAARHPGVGVERKPAHVVMHTRRAEAAVGAAAVAEAMDALSGEPDLGVMDGKQILEFSAVEVSKGHALEALARLNGTSATLYLGDDVTDERAFAVLPRGAGHVSVKVGAGETEAEFRVNGPDEVLGVFRQVLKSRRPLPVE